MTLKEFVDKCSKDGTEDGIVVAASKLRVGYFQVYRWLKGKVKPNRKNRKSLIEHSIDPDS